MYKVVKTELQNINGVDVWVEVKNNNPTLAGNIQQGAEICKVLNETCKSSECYHLVQCGS